MLFDWSEAAWSHPAYDLAILCNGLPTVAEMEEVVALYLKQTDSPLTESPSQWVRWVITARLVSFVRFAALWTQGRLTEAAQPGITMLQEGLMDWMDRVRSGLALPPS